MLFRKPTIKRECITCRKEFMPNHGKQKFCSVNCKEKYYYVKKVTKKSCITCGKIFMQTHGRQKFCVEHRRINIPKLSETPVEKLCVFCGKPFTTSDYRLRYCSSACHTLAYEKQRQERPNREYVPYPYRKTCLFCKRRFKTKKHCQIFCKRTCTVEHNRFKRLIFNQLPPFLRKVELEKLEQQGRNYVFPSNLRE